MIDLVYFAWVRERLDRSEERVALPDGVATVSALVEWLAGRGEAFADVLADRKRIRIAVNGDYVKSDAPVADGDEIAIFPPVTGG